MSQRFKMITLRNHRGMEITLMNYGATWLSCKIPLPSGELREVLLGCRIEDYLKQKAYLGATIGRYANRISNGFYRWKHTGYSLIANQGLHQLHGGQYGFDRMLWDMQQIEEHLVQFKLHSPDGDQGFPGNVEVTVDFSLSEDHQVRIDYYATTDKDTPLNLTNHAYFNLDGADFPVQDVRNHKLQINANYYLPTDMEGIPHTYLAKVEGTGFDFRKAKPIYQDFGQDAHQTLVGGYDHSFLLRKKLSLKELAASLISSDGQVQMDIYTSQPAIQVYTGNFIEGTPMRAEEYHYRNYTGIALETQCLPNSPNNPQWQPDWQKYNGITPAQGFYSHTTIFAFDA